MVKSFCVAIVAVLRGNGEGHKNLPRPHAWGRDGTGVYENESSPGGESFKSRCPARFHTRTWSWGSPWSASGATSPWGDGDRERAVALYTLNTRISESLYTPLQTLEVVLRNRIHFVMTAAVHERWFHEDGFLLGDRQREQLEKAIDDIRAARKEPSPGRIVAELTFSFWTAMLGAAYETLFGSEPSTASAPKRMEGASGAKTSRRR